MVIATPINSSLLHGVVCVPVNQVIADKFGNVACFPERECSIQRRKQKVIEESPSVLLTEETRLKMQQQAADLCQKVQRVAVLSCCRGVGE